MTDVRTSPALENEKSPVACRRRNQGRPRPLSLFYSMSHLVTKREVLFAPGLCHEIKLNELEGNSMCSETRPHGQTARIGNVTLIGEPVHRAPAAAFAHCVLFSRVILTHS